MTKFIKPVVLSGEREIISIVEDPQCHFLPAPAFTVREGFSLHYNLGNSLFSCARDALVRKHPVPGRLWHWFPVSGRFHIGFVLIDDPDRPFQFDFFTETHFRFSMVADRADGLRHIYFTPTAWDVRYPATLEMRFQGDGARQGVEGLVFLSEKPAARRKRIKPLRVRRAAVPSRNAPLSAFQLVNPGRFALASELLRVILPAPWTADTALHLRGRELPFIQTKDGHALVLVDGVSAAKATVNTVASAEHSASPAPLRTRAKKDEVVLRDASGSWRVQLEKEGFRLVRGERSWRFRPVLEQRGKAAALCGSHLRVIETSAFSACVEAGFRYEGWFLSTRLRFTVGSPRVELEHLIENHAAAGFGLLRRYGWRIEEVRKSDFGEVRVIGKNGATRRRTVFRAFYHTEKDADLPGGGCLAHSVLWRGTQFTLGEMRCSAPIALFAGEDRLDVDLLPLARGVQPDPDEEYRIHNQFFLSGDHYKLRAGMARRHFSCLCTEAPATPSGILYEASRLDEPPFLHACLLQRGGRFMENPPFAKRAVYRETVERWTRWYLENRDITRAFGFFGYGDWFGERVNNWGNNEYDTPFGFLANFLLTGDPELRRLGFAAARHQMDVDTAHGGHPKAGWQITHSMAHGGGYFPDGFRPGAYSDGGVKLSHAWVEGLLLYFRLSGDTRARDAAVRLLDIFTEPKRIQNWAYQNGREAGWHLIHLCAGYQTLGVKRYLETAGAFVEKILARQRRDGSFRRVFVADHCLCYPKHTGEVSFMMGILLEGLKRFHLLTEDPVVAQAIIRLGNSVAAEMWEPEHGCFRYTSCPASKLIESFVMIEGLSYAAALEGDRAKRARWQKMLAALAGETQPQRIVRGRLEYSDNAWGKSVSKRFRMFPDACLELL